MQSSRPAKMVWFTMRISLLLMLSFVLFSLRCDAFTATTIAFDQCRIVTESSASVLCAENEIAVNGGGSCSNSSLSMSAPRHSFQGWMVSCTDGSALPLVSVQCCSTSSTGATRNITLQSCSVQSHTAAVLDSRSSLVSVSCLNHQDSVISGGGSCAPGWALGASQPSKAAGWSVECANINAPINAISLTQASVLCCASVPTDSCRHVSNHWNQTEITEQVHSFNEMTLVPSSLMFCNSTEMLLMAGVACPDYAALRHHLVMSPYGLHSSIFAECVREGARTMPAQTFMMCCAVASEAITRPSLSYCDTPNLLRPLGMVTSSHPQSPNSLGASYSLQCDGVMSGASSIVCQPNGQWNGTLGHCHVIVAERCVVIQAAPSDANSSVTQLTCPSSESVLVSTSGLCTKGANQSVLSVDEPTSLSSWQSSCRTEGQADRAADLVTGICCPSHISAIWSQCRFVSQTVSSQNLCKPTEAPLLIGIPQSNLTNAVCCPALTNSSVPLTSNHSSYPNIMVVSESCLPGQILLSPGAMSIFNRVGSITTISSTDVALQQRWSRTSFLRVDHTNEGSMPLSQCYDAQPLCGWIQPFSRFADFDKIALIWPLGSSTVFHCLDGYEVLGTGQSHVSVSCNASNMLVQPPECRPSVCSPLTASLGFNVSHGSIFDTTGAVTRLSCDSDAPFSGSAQLVRWIKCTGSVASGGFDWQPAPATFVCNESPSSSRRLLQVTHEPVDSPWGYSSSNNGTSSCTPMISIAGSTASCEFVSPYSAAVQFSWSDIVTVYNLANPHGVQCNDSTQLVIVVAPVLNWPKDGVSESFQGFSGLTRGVTNILPYNAAWHTTLDGLNSIAAIELSAVVSLRIWLGTPEVVNSLDDVRGEVFTMTLGGECVLSNTTGTMFTYFNNKECDITDPQFAFTTYSDSLVLVSLASTTCFTLGPSTPSSPRVFSTTPIDCDSPDALILFPRPAGSLVFRVKHQGMIYCPAGYGSNAPLGRYLGWTLCTFNPASIHVTFAVQRINANINQTAEVGNVTMKAPCGCDVVGNPDGLPAQLSLYQRIGVDQAFRISFVPQSLCTSEYSLMETTNGSSVLVDIPTITGYAPSDLSSCSASQYSTISTIIEDLTWDQTCVNRTFCLVPLPRDICPTCTGQYIPGRTSPNMSLACVTKAAQFWFTVIGKVITPGGVSGISAAVSNVSMELQVIEPIPDADTVEWSASPLTSTAAVTDVNGMFDTTISKSFDGGPRQFYTVQGRPSKTHQFDDPHPTILVPDPLNVASLQLAQIGQNEHILIDIAATQQTTIRSRIQMLVDALLMCPELGGNVTDYDPSVCTPQLATMIRITVTVNNATEITTQLVAFDGSVMETDTVTSAAFDAFSWDVPFYILMLQDPRINSPFPLQGQAVFGLIKNNPFNGSYPISITPMMFDQDGKWISPHLFGTLPPDLAPRLVTLVVPPSLKELEASCAPVCNLDPDPSIVIQSGLSPVTVTQQTVPSRPDLVIDSQIVKSGSSSYWMSVALASGANISFPCSSISSLNAVRAKTGSGASQTIANETDKTSPIEIVVEQLALIELSPFSGPAGLRVWPAGRAVITLLNSSAITEPVSAQLTEWLAAHSSGSSQLATVLTTVPPTSSTVDVFTLVTAIDHSVCLQPATSCSTVSPVKLGICSTEATWKYQSSMLYSGAVPDCSLVLQIKDSSVKDSAVLQIASQSGNDRWSFNTTSQLQSAGLFGSIAVSKLSAGSDAFMPVAAMPLSMDVGPIGMNGYILDLVTNQSVSLPGSAGRLHAADIPSPRSASALSTDNGNVGLLLNTGSSFTWSLWFYLRPDNFDSQTASPWSDAVPHVLISAEQYNQPGQWVGGFTPTELFLGFGTVPCASAQSYSDPTLNSVYTVPGGWTANQWYHAAFVLDEDLQMSTLYFNGVQVSQHSVSNFNYLANQKVQLGSETCISYNFAGDMQCVGMWDQALGPDQIGQLYLKQVQPGSCQQLYDYVPLPALPIPPTHSNARCVTADLSLMIGKTGACSINEVDPSQQWITGVTGTLIPPIARTRSFDHVFEFANGFDATAIGTSTLTFAQTMYFPLIWFDQSMTALSGMIRIAENPLLPGVSSCGMPNIVVQAFSISDTQLENPIASSIVTDGSGQWIMAIPVQQVVVIVPQYVMSDDYTVHQFEPANLTVNVVQQPISGLTFNDTSVQNFTASVVGGLCDIEIAQVPPIIVLDSCASRRFVIATPTFSNNPTSYSLPALAFKFLSYPGRTSEPTLIPRNNMSPFEMAALGRFLLTQGQIDADLHKNNQSVVLRYYSQAEMEVIGPNWAEIAQCTEPASGSPYSILRQGSVIALEFQVTEPYGQQTCKIINSDLTHVWVRDLVLADSSSECFHPGCLVNVSTNGRSKYTTRIGKPYFLERDDGPDFSRDLLFGIAGTPQAEANKISIVSSGTSVFAGAASLKIAPSSLNPLYILRRPPGGTSVSVFSGSCSMSTDVSMDISSSLDSSLGYEKTFSGQFETQAMVAPLGVGISYPAAGFSGQVEYAGNVPVLPKLPNERKVRELMLVPEFNPDVFASVLARTDEGMYDPSDPVAPFRPSQDCSVFSIIKGLAEAEWQTISSIGEDIYDGVSSAASRRLLAAEYDCTTTTEKSVSLGQSATYSVEATTTDDPAIIDGDGDMFLFAIHDVLVSYTNVLVAFAPDNAQMAQTVIVEWNEALSATLSTDPSLPPNVCRIMKPHQVLTASSSGNSQLLWVSRWTIMNEIIPFSKSVAVEYDGRTLDQSTQVFVDSVKANEANWMKILEYNDQLKAKAVPWPELMSYLTFNSSMTGLTSSGRENMANPLYLEGEDLVVSFGGDMGSLSFTIEIAAEQGTDSSSSLDTDRSSSASLGGSVNVGGFGLSVNLDWSYANSRSVGSGTEQSSSNDRSLTFELSDPDRGDMFDVIIRRDPVYNTPVFITRSGRSRCPYEQGTVARESLELRWKPSGFSSTSDSYTAVLEISNTGVNTENEEFAYYLNVNTETNVNAWSIMANGVPVMQNTVKITVPSRAKQITPTNILIVLTGGQGSPSGLVFQLTGVCYEDIVSPKEYAFTSNITWHSMP